MKESRLLYSINGFKKSDLSHHGRPGMHWGERNGPPYPLGMTNAQYKAKQNANYGHKLSYAKGTAKNISRQLTTEVLARVPIVNIPVLIKYADRTLSSRWKVSSEYVQKHDGDIKKVKDLNKKSTETTATDDMKKINPRKLIGAKGTYNNCGYCSLAMDMRRRGYDVRARIKESGVNHKDLLSMYKNGKFETINPITKDGSTKIKKSQSIKNIGDVLESQGPGARGIITITYKYSFSGHAMFYENDKNGQLTVYDGQSKTKNPSDIFTISNLNTIMYMRTDKLQPTEKIAEAVTDKFN